MNHLVLGGAGFIGQHLTQALFKQKLRQTGVTVIDNLSTGRDPRDRFAEYKNLYRFYDADLTTITEKELLEIVRKHDKIWHLASSVGVEHIDRDPAGTLFNNVALNNNLIKFFQKARRHVIFTSTSEIYGNGPFNEEDYAHIPPTSKLRGAYAASKLMTEFMIRASDFPYTIVRLFNAVGPGQLGDYGMVLPRFVAAAKANQDILVYGTGTQVRSFCHVHDAVQGMLLASKTTGEVYNVGRDTPISIAELAQLVIEITGSSSKIVHVPYEQAFSKHHQDIDYRVPDLTKIKALGYEPQYSIEDTIKDMIC